MHISVIAPPHLDSNTAPSKAMRIFLEAENALLGYLTGGEDFDLSADHALNALRPASVRKNVMLAASTHEGSVRAQDDDTDLGFLGFARVSFPLAEGATSAAALFTFVDDYREEVFSALLTEVETLCANHGRTHLKVHAIMAPVGLESDPQADSLRTSGFKLAMVEQMSLLELGDATPPQLPTGLQSVTFTGYIPPEEHIDSFLELLTIAHQDIPGADNAAGTAPWTRERLEEAQRHHGRSATSCVNALLVDTEGVAALTYAMVNPEKPECASQELTATHTRVRGNGLGTLVKQVLWAQLAAQFPQVRRVSTFNATTNASMLAINEKLGMKPVAIETIWQKKL